MTKIKGFKNIELNTLLVYDNRYIKTKIRTHGIKVYINFLALNMLENGVECEAFAIFLLYLDKCAYKMTDYLGDSLFVFY